MHMFHFFVLAQTIGACLGKDTIKLKEKISACIQYILPNPEYQKKSTNQQPRRERRGMLFS